MKLGGVEDDAVDVDPGGEGAFAVDGGRDSGEVDLGDVDTYGVGV